MIQATILKAPTGAVVGFTVKNHGQTHVCAAVSMLVINTVNSIVKLTALTDTCYTCQWDDGGGFVTFQLNTPELRGMGPGILLDALELGLASVVEQYPKDLTLKELKI